MAIRQRIDEQQVVIRQRIDEPQVVISQRRQKREQVVIEGQEAADGDKTENSRWSRWS